MTKLGRKLVQNIFLNEKRTMCVMSYDCIKKYVNVYIAHFNYEIHSKCNLKLLRGGENHLGSYAEYVYL